MSTKPVFFKLVSHMGNLEFFGNLEVEIHAAHDGVYQQMTPKITESELDGYIDKLIGELEQIRKEGKRKFKTAKKIMSQVKPEDLKRTLMKKVKKP